MKIALAFALANVLSACTAEYQAVVTAGPAQAATAADNQLKLAEWAWCRASSHGAVMRRYGGKTEIWRARLKICWPDLALERVTKVDP